MKAGSTVMTQRPRDRVLSGSMFALPDPRRPDRANPPTNFDDAFFDSTGMIYTHWLPTGHTVHKENYVELLREFRKRFRRKRPASFKSGHWHFHQDNAPVHNSILVTDYLSKIGLKTVPHTPCDFWLFPKLRGCRYETIEEMKEAVTKVMTLSHKRTFMGPSRSCWNGTTSALQPEEITSKRTRVSCVYYQ